MSEMNELQTLRHSASHVMAQAVKRLFPDVKLAIGPAIDNGFLAGYETAELNGNIKREDVAVLVDRILGLEECEIELNFEDSANIADSKIDSVKKIYSAGIMEGYTDNTFKPANNLTRAEAVVIISRVTGSKEAADEK